jgi:acetolactate synthase I/II/III large subunit
MNEKSAGHWLVECLIAQGATHAFGVPGESYLAVLDGLHQHADQIEFVTCRQEGGAAFMAEAHGKLTGRPGVCMVTRGPGATNASIGVHTAFQDSTPMVLLVGDVASDCRDREAFQEVDFGQFFGPMAKRVERIDEAARIPEYVQRAFATALSGRPGPVVLVLPEDMLTQAIPEHLWGLAQQLGRTQATPIGLAPQVLDDMQAALLEATQPLVVLGGGGWTPQAAQDVQAWAEHWQLPVANAFRFQDCFDNRHPQYAGDMGLAINPKLAQRIAQADCLMVIGARLGESTTDGYTRVSAPLPRQRLVHIHASAEEANRVFKASISACADMPSAAAALRQRCVGAPPAVPWTDWTQAARRDYDAHVDVGNGGTQLPGTMDMPAVIHTLSRYLPTDAVLTNGAGNFASWLHRFYAYVGLASGHKTQLAPTNGAMGYGVPAGVAAAIATRGTGRVVFTIAGDGDFLMNGQELATACQHGAKTIVLLLNNGMYGTIRMHQERHYPARLSGSNLRNPDFCALAQAYGYQAQRITHTSAFEPALQAALASEVGYLIEVMLDPEVITTKATLTTLRQAALDQAAQAQAHAALRGSVPG